jgi:hypothetical protein
LGRTRTRGFLAAGLGGPTGAALAASVAIELREMDFDEPAALRVRAAKKAGFTVVTEDLKDSFAFHDPVEPNVHDVSETIRRRRTGARRVERRF